MNAFPLDAPPRRRGLTLIEVMISGSLMLGIFFTLAGISRFVSIFWQQGMAVSFTQASSQTALQLMIPSIRAARRVVMEKSSSTRLTIQLPAYDAAGSLLIPLADGAQVTYYLSDKSGGVTSNGTILWRAVNGVPDEKWSMGGGKPRVMLGAQGLSFEYYPAVDPESVTVTVTATRVIGTRTDTLPTSQEVILQNRGL